MSARWLKLTLAYDGSVYAGWQIQPDKPTVQGTLESALRQITQEVVRVTAAGRTDAGVHALGQVVGCTTATRLSNADLQRALNAVLPNDIAVLSIEDAPDGFHATRDAVAKRYRYQIHNGRTPSVFDRHYAWHYPQPLDAAAMHTAGQVLLGRHDFSSFETAGSERPDSIRTIHELSVTRGSEELADRVTIDVAGDGFLYNMVRTIVGTLVEVGTGACDLNWPAAVLAACDRRQAGQTAPPHGLFLVSVSYEE
ncbi:MAG TPA: tRNA pseudouridine(38-40) synthase TruA [Lacipirellulaceae bacterium]|nr:tRNA pseudouridine(38-40) synthase TruA [Lacipirellulaceae bacterium]